MAEHWKLTLRRGPKVTTQRFGSLDAALDAAAAELAGADVEPLRPRRVFHREIAPVAQVAMRAEIAGPQRLLPRVHAGVDVRGDGSAEPFTGRLNRAVVEQRDGEGPVDALRRTLTPTP